MVSLTLVIAVTAFISGVTAALFAVVVIGIHRNGIPRSPHAPRNASLDSFTRAALGTRTWPNELVADCDRDDG